MSSVDSRIVQMQFDNRQFESGAKTSMSTLDKLKQSLNFGGAAKSLNQLENQGRNFNMNGVANAAETVSSRFSALGIMGATVLVNLTNSAINLGKALVNALTMAPIMDGFREYETLTNAVKVIRANVRDASMAEINDTLDVLNEYADLTIYNFGQMTDAIGKFTAAGVSLDTSTMAVKGLANMAAGAGVHASRLYNAYTQVSQALQSGVFKLLDWNSLQNAGLANVEFQERLRSNAESLGIAVDRTVSFRDSLQDAWLTTEVFMKTMEQAVDVNDEWGASLTAAATEVTGFTQLVDTVKEALGTGWATSMETVIGDYEEAKGLFTEINRVIGGMIGAMSEVRNVMLDAWDKLGGRRDLIIGLFNAMDAVYSLLKPIGDAFKNVFPPLTAERFAVITAKFREFTDRMKLSEPTMEKIYSIFRGLFSILDLGVTIITTVAKGFGALLSFLSPVGEGILSIVAGFGDLIYNFTQFVKGSPAMDHIAGLFERLGASRISIAGIGDALKSVGAWLSNIRFKVPDLKWFSDMMGKINVQLPSFAGGFESIKAAIAGFFNSFSEFEIVKRLQEMVGNVKTALGGIASGFAEMFNIENLRASTEVFVRFVHGVLLIALAKILNMIANLGKKAGEVTDAFIEILVNIAGVIDAFEAKVKAEALIRFAGALVLFVAALIGLQHFAKGEKTLESLVLLTALAGGLVLVVNALGTISVAAPIVSIGKLVAVLMSIGPVLAALTGLVGVLTLMDRDRVNMAMLQLGAIMAGLVAAMAVMSGLSVQGGIFFSVATGLSVLVAALVLLSKTVESDRMWETVGAISALAVVIGVIAGVMTTSLPGATAMLAIAGALAILTPVLIAWSFVPWEKLAIAAGIMIVLTGGIALLANTMTAALPGATAMIAIAAAFLLLTPTVIAFAIIPWERLAQAGIVIIALMAGMALLGATMTAALPGATAMLAMAASIGILAAAIIFLGEVPVSGIVKAIVGLVAAIVAFGLVSLAIIPTVGVPMGILAGILVTLGGAIALVGVGIAGIGAGVLLAAKGIDIVVNALTTAGDVSLDTANTIAQAAATIIKAISSLSPDILKIADSISILAMSFVLFGVGAAAAGVGIAALAASIIVFTLSLTVLAAGIMGIIALFALLYSAVKGIFPDITRAADEGTKEVEEALIIDEPKIEESYEQVGADMDRGLIRGSKPAITTSTEIGETVAGNITEPIEPATMEAEAAAGMDGVVTGINKKLPEITKASNGAGIAIVSGMEKALRASGGLVDTYLSGIKDKIMGQFGGMPSQESLLAWDLSFLFGDKSMTEQEMWNARHDWLQPVEEDPLADFTNSMASAGKSGGSALGKGVEEGLMTEQEAIKIMAAEYGENFITIFNDTIEQEASKPDPKVEEAMKTLGSSYGDAAISDVILLAEAGFTSLEAIMAELTNTLGEEQLKALKDASDFRHGVDREKALTEAMLRAAGYDISAAGAQGMAQAKPQYEAAGADSIQAFGNGMVSKQGVVDTSIKTMKETALNEINLFGKEAYAEVMAAAEEIKSIMPKPLSVEDGGRRQHQDIPAQWNNGWYIADGQVVEGAWAPPTSKSDAAHNMGYSDGKSYGAGVSAGIRSSNASVSNATHEMGRSGSDGLRDEWDIHSPSRVGYGFGQNFGFAIASGIESMITRATLATTTLSTKTTDVLKNAVKTMAHSIEDENYQPKIKPVLDLDNINKGVKIMSRSLALTSELHVDSVMAKRIQNGSGELNSAQGPSPTYQFNQYNSSPKALSPLEIYRQTKNQFSAFKGAVSQT